MRWKEVVSNILSNSRSVQNIQLLNAVDVKNYTFRHNRICSRCKLKGHYKQFCKFKLNKVQEFSENENVYGNNASATDFCSNDDYFEQMNFHPLIQLFHHIPNTNLTF